ncbi:MAG: 2OG-Fe(II) oxygenase [Pyrinomonadaceae bacterium]
MKTSIQGMVACSIEVHEHTGTEHSSGLCESRKKLTEFGSRKDRKLWNKLKNRISASILDASVRDLPPVIIAVMLARALRKVEWRTSATAVIPNARETVVVCQESHRLWVGAAVRHEVVNRKSLKGGSRARRRMLSRELDSRGYLIIDRFLSTFDCECLIKNIQNHRRRHPKPIIHRTAKTRPLRYFVIDGDEINRYFPDVVRVNDQVTSMVRAITNDRIVPLYSSRVACNINITPRAGSYRYHYDRNQVTAILYLNETKGGETECYPNYRWLLGRKTAPLQRALDHFLQIEIIRKISGKQILVKPRQGRLLIMRGDRCLHSVLPVQDDGERINIVMAYDDPLAEDVCNTELDAYLYEPGQRRLTDPNYS